MSNGKTVFITGASRGIGAGLALAFAVEGYEYIGINYSRDGQGAAETAEKVRALGARCGIYQADVSSYGDCERALTGFIQDAGKIDVLINNAGGGLRIPTGGFEKMPIEYWDQQIGLNLNAAAYTSHLALRDMLEKGTRGAIINISSVHGTVTWVKRKMLPYCAAKAGVEMLTKALGVEVAKYGIRVNCIAPGFIKTQATTRYSPDQLEGFERKIPAGVLGEPADLAPMALLLADEEKSRFIIGQTFTIDGGQSIDGAIDNMMYDY